MKDTQFQSVNILNSLCQSYSVYSIRIFKFVYRQLSRFTEYYAATGATDRGKATFLKFFRAFCCRLPLDDAVVAVAISLQLQMTKAFLARRQTDCCQIAARPTSRPKKAMQSLEVYGTLFPLSACWTVAHSDIVFLYRGLPRTNKALFIVICSSKFNASSSHN